MALYLVTKDMPGYRSGLHTISPDMGHKHRHLLACRASPSGALCSISIQKGACKMSCAQEPSVLLSSLTLDCITAAPAHCLCLPRASHHVHD